MAVVIETTLGDITVDLFIKERPKTCLNFLKLCKMKYYNFNLFHSVQHNFIAQTGDPTGTGNGGESVFSSVYGDQSKYYAGEQMPKIKHARPGLVSMVNCGDNMLGAQFFITLGTELSSLDGEHCVFGEVSEGEDILLKLNEAICDELHRPYQDIRITHTVILEDPFDDPPNFKAPERSPSPSAERLANGRLAPDEAIDEMQGKTMEEIEEMAQEKEAAARATILEIVGDLPDADMAPPENVLFICKLNPVTSDDDLEIIFSRFGKINSCEVIRDKVSGDSLQYAFIEFDEQKSCEEAYFKMDNVLIDDRRIHVDFSQSVAKMRWKGKGRGVEYLDGGKPDIYQKNNATQQDSRRSSNKFPDRYNNRGETSWSPSNKSRIQEGQEQSWGKDRRREETQRWEDRRRFDRPPSNNRFRHRSNDKNDSRVVDRRRSRDQGYENMSKGESSHGRDRERRYKISPDRNYSKSRRNVDSSPVQRKKAKRDLNGDGKRKRSESDDRRKKLSHSDKSRETSVRRRQEKDHKRQRCKSSSSESSSVSSSEESSSTPSSESDAKRKKKRIRKLMISKKKRVNKKKRHVTESSSESSSESSDTESDPRTSKRYKHKKKTQPLVSHQRKKLNKKRRQKPTSTETSTSESEELPIRKKRSRKSQGKKDDSLKKKKKDGKRKRHAKTESDKSSSSEEDNRSKKKKKHSKKLSKKKQISVSESSSN